MKSRKSGMKVWKKAVKTMGYPAAALAGLAAAALLFLSIMAVEIKDSSMLPLLEPGSRVIAVRTAAPVDFFGASSLAVGDLVVYRAPYYEIGGSGVYLVRKISGMNGDMIEVCGGADAGAAGKEILSRESILGKVVYNG